MTAASLVSPNSDLLHFDTSISTSNTNVCSAYYLFDCCASHHYVDAAYTNWLGLKHRLGGCIRVSVAGEVPAEEDRWQVWLTALSSSSTMNCSDISRWDIILDLGGIYDLLVGIGWTAANLPIIHHETNTLGTLGPD